ncbi:hypothetical protein FXO37_30046 [Capsicum annuum]|nr:hypothetical protein FXO37_30046 [Capsicum annuum]
MPCPMLRVNLKDREAVAGTWRETSKVPMATDSVDVLERIASQLFTTTHKQQFNKEEIQVVSYRNKLFADVKSEPLLDASVPNMDVVINAPVSGGISLIPSSLSQAKSPKLLSESLCNSKSAIIQLGFCSLTLTELRCSLLDTPNEQIWPWRHIILPMRRPWFPNYGPAFLISQIFSPIFYLWEARLRGFLPLVLLYQHVASHGRRISNSCGAHSILGSHPYSLLGMDMEILVHLLGLSITIACIVLSSSLTSPCACALGLCFTRVGQRSMLGLSHKRLS